MRKRNEWGKFWGEKAKGGEMDYSEERAKCTESIISSKANKIIIVAGPGTGKTYTFSEFLKVRGGKNLAITFINNLANDLKIKLSGLAESHTFHSFCKSLLHKLPIKGITNDPSIYPNLDDLIKSDAIFLGYSYSGFQNKFRTLQVNNEATSFFIDRSNYYNTVSFDDYVYRVYSHLQENPESIPTFNNIVIDEYQDFHSLEVKFIDLLATQSNVLIVGDDDQALYEEIRNSSPRFIREKAGDDNFSKFELPYCSRCTQVVVDAVNDVVKFYTSKGALQERIDKEFKCFLPDKETDSNKFPKIADVNCTIQKKDNQYISRYIETEINRIEQPDFEEAKEEGYYPILIIGPKHYLKQVASYFEERDSYKVDYSERIPSNMLLDGYNFLMYDNDSNIGWRLVIEIDNSIKIQDIIRNTQENGTQLHELLDRDYIDKHSSSIEILKNALINGIYENGDKTTFYKTTGIKLEEALLYLTKEDDITNQQDEDNSLIPIKLTTFCGSKGLSAGFVFVIGLNNGVLPKDHQNIRDLEIKEFIVALSRTRKKCYLISNNRFGANWTGGKSCFINSINGSRREQIIVNKDYFVE